MLAYLCHPLKYNLGEDVATTRLKETMNQISAAYTAFKGMYVVNKAQAKMKSTAHLKRDCHFSTKNTARLLGGFIKVKV